ncbi:MAG TPA: SDR family oxidoreductase, partial [Actinomycetota bacterium]
MILVIGATGTVGSEVVRQLVATGERPRALVRDPAAARQRLGEEVEHVVGDLDRPETIAAALAGVDRVFLLTTQSSRQPEWERAVIGAAARAGVGQLVKLSVFRADEQSPLQVARQHGQAERVLAQSGLAATILRPVFFMQNLLAMVHDAAIATAAGDGRVAMVDARDIAAVAVATLTGGGHAGKTYTLTGPEALSFYQVASILSRQTGRPLRHVRVPPDKVRV